MTSVAVVSVDLPLHPYKIDVGRGVLVQVGAYASLVAGHSVVIVTNTLVGQHYSTRLQQAFEQAGKKVSLITLPDGEQYKTLESLNQIFTALLSPRRLICVVCRSFKYQPRCWHRSILRWAAKLR